MSVHRNLMRLSEKETLRTRVAVLVSLLVDRVRCYHRQAVRDRRESRGYGDAYHQSMQRFRAMAQAYMDSARDASRAVRGYPTQTLTERRRSEVYRRRDCAEANPEVAQ